MITNNIIKWLRHIDFLMIFENGEWPDNNNGGATLRNVQGSLSSKSVRQHTKVRHPEPILILGFSSPPVPCIFTPASSSLWSRTGLQQGKTKGNFKGRRMIDGCGFIFFRIKGCSAKVRGGEGPSRTVCQ